jgi:hypothetical protein
MQNRLQIHQFNFWMPGESIHNLAISFGDYRRARGIEKYASKLQRVDTGI